MLNELLAISDAASQNCAVTPPVPPITPPVVTIPNIDDLAVTSPNCSTATLSWSDITGEDAYRVRRKTLGGVYEIITDVPANTTTYTDDSVEPNTAYEYMVRPMDNGVAVAISNVPTVEIPSCPVVVLPDTTVPPEIPEIPETPETPETPEIPESPVQNLTVMPIVVKDYAELQYELLQRHVLTIQIYNSQGSIIRNFTEQNSHIGQNHTWIKDSHQLSTGSYWVKVSINGTIVATTTFFKN
jgi:hypothetical protein